VMTRVKKKLQLTFPEGSRCYFLFAVKGK